MLLPCGIEVEPGMTRQQIYQIPEVKSLISVIADRQAGSRYDRSQALDDDDDFWDFMDDFVCTTMELQNKFAYAIKRCAERLSGQLMSTGIGIYNLEGMLVESDLPWGEEDFDGAGLSFGEPPRHAGDCIDCPHPAPRACSACSML